MTTETHDPALETLRAACAQAALPHERATVLSRSENVLYRLEAGIVARSVADTPDLSWTLVDDRLHAPLDQVAAVIARTKQADAATSFIEFVNGVQGRGVMRQFGFLLPNESF